MKKILMALALTSMTSVAMAQQSGEVVVGFEEIQVQDKYQVLTNTFWDNWFLSLGGGASMMFGTNDKVGSFGDRISPTLNVAVGKWFTPGLGLRLQYSGLQANGSTYDAGASYVRGTQMKDGYYKQRFDYMNLHADVLFNLNALFGGYNRNRVYEIIPYLGAGFTHNYTAPQREALAVNAGIINRFRISNAVDINLEIAGMAVEDKFDGEIGGKYGFDGVLSATLGLTYRFPQRGFNRPFPQLISQAELAVMQAQLAEMALTNQQLKNALVVAQNQPVAEVSETEIVVPDPNIVPRTVFFTINSADVTPREVMNISFLAKQMNEFPEATYTVNGYADSSTGTPAYNQALSLKRAQAVVNVLTKQYGISPARLKAEAGGGVNEFGQPILNRVVLVKSAE